MTFEPIGIIRSPFQSSSGTPIQPRAAEGVEGAVEVLPAYTAGLKDLDGFDRIWLIYAFDRAGSDGCKLVVTPYLGGTPRGVFATRAPARPNPIGISAVRLIEVSGGTLKIRDIDILDGTPLLDIKPYVPQFDCYEAARPGWVAGASLTDKVADGRFDAAAHKKRS
jgi:tRNA-Thr(GGU) m(6)t(6)A37 methyltransferase TsaA